MFLTQTHSEASQWWRFIAVAVAVILAFVIGHTPLILTVQSYAKSGGFSDAEVDQLLATGGVDMIGINSTFGLLLILIPFAVAFCVFFLAVRWFHKRSGTLTLTSRPRFDVKRMLVGASVWLVIGGGGTLVIIPNDLITYQFDLLTFIPLLVVVLLLMPLQVAIEEVIFRGYVLQGITRFFVRPLAPLLITTLVFLIPHLSNPEFHAGFTKVAPIYFVLSLFFGLLAVLDEGLELPIGAHLGNNIFAALILSTTDGAMNTDSIAKTSVSAVLDYLWIIVLFVPLTLLALHMIYRFDWGKLVRPYRSRPA